MNERYTHKDDLIERNAGLRSEIERLQDRVEKLEAENEELNELQIRAIGRVADLIRENQELRELLQEIQEGGGFG